VGFNGYPHNINHYNENINFVSVESYPSSFGLILDTQLDVQTPMLLQGVEWIYSWLEAAFAFSSTILYESSITPTDLTDLEHFIWAYDYKLANFIIISIYYDLQNFGKSLLLPHIDAWYNYLHIASNNIIFHLEHPEHNLLYSAAIVDFLLPYVSKFRFLIELETPTEGVILIPFVILDILWKIGLFALFASFFMYWYNISVNGNNIDSDFLVNSLSIESEEEIASIDDTVLLLVIIFFIFGWFFFF
jgi:hypothetical protein